MMKATTVAEGMSGEARPKRDVVHMAIKAMLEEQPLTNEEIRRVFVKRGMVVSLSTVRKVCSELRERVEIKGHTIKSARYRMGVSLWSKLDERPETIAAIAARMGGEKASSFKIGRGR